MISTLSRNSRKWPNSRYILERESIGFADGFGWNIRERVADDSNI